jgi:methylglutaconyl-CoA hydratase
MVEGLEIERADHTLVVTADRGAENLFSLEMIDALSDVVDDAARDGLRFARIRARGPVFCVGRERAATTPLALRDEAASIVRANETFRTTPLTVIAEVQGDAAGFGAGLVASADIAVASDRARLWFPEILGGLAPSVVISWLSKSIPYKVAYDMVTSGDPVDPREAQRLGLLTDVVPAAELEAAVDERLKRLADMSPGAIREIKEFFVRIRGLDPSDSSIAAVETLALSAVRNKAEKEQASA